MQTQRDMTLYYENVDITDEVDIIECVCRDTSGGESDCLNLLVDHADRWFRWGPQKNDKIRATRSGYDTKTLFLSAIAPEDGAFRIYATARKCGPFPPQWASYENKTLGGILNACAAENGMSCACFGTCADILYKYILRDDVSAPAFMRTLAGREGAVLKALDGRFCAIGIEWAQGLSAMHEMELDGDQADSEYIDRRDARLGGLKIKTPFGSGEARDDGARGRSLILTDIAVDDDAQAYRWAKGLLLLKNRLSEQLNVEMDFNAGYTAMARVDVKSDTDARGQWIVDSVEQNLVDGRTKAKLLRCLSGIG